MLEEDFKLFIPIEDIAEEQKTVVYLAQNTNGEFYIGATTDKKRRIYNHLYQLKNNIHGKGKDLFQQAYNRNPDFNFKAFPVETKNEAFQLENSLIKKYIDDDKCLNMDNVRPPPVVTDETRKKISIAVRLHNENREFNPHIGRKISEETRQKMSLASKKTWEIPATREKMLSFLRSDEFREKIGNVHRGKIESEETRMKKSLAKKGIPQDPEFVKKRTAFLIGRKRPQELNERLTAENREKINALTEEENEKRLLKLKSSSQLGANKTRIPINFNGKSYSSISEAIKAEKISSSTFYKLIKQQGYEVGKK